MTQVDHFVEVTFMEGRDEHSLRPRPGALGVGHRDNTVIFGEVMNADIGRPSFTMRCYQVDEYFDLERMSKEGLVLDAGSSRNRVEVPAAEITRALERLPQPAGTLQVGDTVRLERKYGHPAWMDQVKTDEGIRYVAPEKFTALIADDATITDRREREEGPLLRASNGFWYNPDGIQEDAQATTIISPVNLLGGDVVRDEPEAEAEAEAEAEVEVQTSVTPESPQAEHEQEHEDALSAACAELDSRNELLNAALDEWNPDSPKMQPKIELASTLLNKAVTLQDIVMTTAEAARATDTPQQHRDALAFSVREFTTDMDSLMVSIGVPPHGQSAQSRATALLNTQVSAGFTSASRVAKQDAVLEM